MYKKNELPVTLDVEFTENMGICVTLCILTTEKKYKNWIYTNYMMPVACMKDDDMFEYIIADCARYGWLSQTPYALMKFSFVSDSILKEVRDIVGLLIERINIERYCVLFLDNYYLPCELSYQREHFVHEILIYGYDMEERVFQIITYNHKIQSVKLAFGDLEKGYEAAFAYIKETDGWDECMLMQYSLIDHTKDCPFNKKQYWEKLQLYREGKMPEEVYFKRYLYQNYSKQDCFYGLKANEAMFLKMKKVKEMFIKGEDNKKYDLFRQYGPIHTYAEFHKALYKRLLYYDTIFPVGLKEKEMIKSYKRIVEECEIVRYLYLKIQVLIGWREDKKVIKTLDSIISKLEF